MHVRTIRFMLNVEAEAEVDFVEKNNIQTKKRWRERKKNNNKKKQKQKFSKAKARENLFYNYAPGIEVEIIKFEI